MKCEKAEQDIVLVTYGELPDERMASLEQHLAECEACNRELKAMLAMHEALAYLPMLDPSPNLLAQSRMRLDEELDSIPPHGFITRLRSIQLAGPYTECPCIDHTPAWRGLSGRQLYVSLSGCAPAEDPANDDLH